ncbi:MAG: glycosyltransferase [bacterium]|nr:glycosyltransferase [bacterium]
MNIVIFTDTFLPKIDGVGISVGNFTRLLSARGHNFVICAPEYEKNETVELADNVRIVRFRNAGLPSYPDVKVVLPSQKRIAKAMSYFKPDLVHIQTPGLLGQYGVLAAKMYGVPLIGTYHTLVSEQDTYVSLYRLLKVDALLDFFASDKKVKKRLEKIERKKEKSLKKTIILKLCNGLYETGRLIITPSHLIKEELQREGVQKPIEVVSNGMDLTRFKSEPRTAPGNPPRFLHVGRISYEKNCDVILKAFALILPKVPGATLDIYGDGPALTSLKIHATQLGIESNVVFHGFVDHATLPEVYPRYDMFLTASTMETQGLVVLEAAACGLPCIGVDAFALPELIQHNRNGYIVEPFDHISLAEKTMELLGDPETYHRFSKQSLEIAQDHEINKCADRMEAVYKMVATGQI